MLGNRQSRIKNMPGRTNETSFDTLSRSINGALALVFLAFGVRTEPVKRMDKANQQAREALAYGAAVDAGDTMKLREAWEKGQACRAAAAERTAAASPERS